MPLTAVLFDLDGTLLNTLADIASAMNQTLQNHGLHTHPVEAYRRFVGSGTRELVRRATAGAANGLEDTLLREMQVAYGENPTQHTRPYDGIPETLLALGGSGVRLAVLSNKDDRFVQTIIAEVLPSIEFDQVMGLTPRFPAKPDPGSALEISRLLHVDPAEVLYVGDSDVDMITATRAGMYGVGAGWGFRSVDELRDAGAKAIVMRPEEILELIGGRSKP